MTSGRRLAANPWIVDVAVASAVFLCGALVGYRYLAARHDRTMVEWELAPAVMVACGAGFSRPALEPPGLIDFLLRRRESFQCTELAGATGITPVPVAAGERYAIYAAGIGLRAGGISWHTLDVYLGVLFGVSMVFAYALFRLVAGTLIAALGIVCLVWSNQLPALLSFRDYGKQPVFYALWLVLGWLVWRGRERPGRDVHLLACLAGALVGLGLGFRTDLLVFVPAFVGVLVFAVAGWDRSALRTKVVAATMFLIAFATTGAPILRTMSAGSNSAHVVILGLMRSYDRTLGLQPPPYDIGDTYSDTYVFNLVTAHAHVVQRETEPMQLGSSRYDRAGAWLLADLGRNLPADGLIRAFAATVQIVRYPFDGYAREEYRSVTPLNASVFRTIGDLRGRALGVVEGHELLFGAVVLLLASFRDWRLGVIGVVLMLYFCGYSMLQFSRRHTFHLDIVPVGLIVMAVQFAVTASRQLTGSTGRNGRSGAVASSPSMQAAFAGMLAMASLAAALYCVLLATRTWQQRHVTRLIDRSLALAWETTDTAPEPLADTTVRDGKPITTWSTVFESNPQRWGSAVLLRVGRPGVPVPHWIQLESMLVELGGPCGRRQVQVGLKYTGVETNENYEFTRVFDIPIEPTAGSSRLLVPVFYQDGPQWTRFDGFAVPADDIPCVVGVSRARVPGEIPLPLMNAVLPPRWRELPLYERLQRTPLFTAAGTPASISKAASVPDL